jgi:hypothetical protein
VQDPPRAADVERRVQVAPQHVAIALGVVVGARYLADEEEIRLPQVGGKLFNAPAEVSALLLGDVLERIEPEAVAVRERDPVLEAPRDVAERIGVVVVEVAEAAVEVGALVLGCA